MQIEVEFKIEGSGNLHGDGFAMWLTKQRATQGPVFGSTDNFEGLGIFFDTYKNNRPGTSFPYVMAMMGDGQTTYDQAHDGKANELAGCSVSIVCRGAMNVDLTIAIGSWSPWCLHPYQGPLDLLPGQVLDPGPAVQVRGQLDSLLRADCPRVQHRYSLRCLPGLLCRDW